MSDREAWGVTLLRVVLGTILVMHGWFGMMVLGPAGLASYAGRLGYPHSLGMLFAWYLIVAHIAGGVLLVIGLWTRPAALAQFPVLASTTFFLHWSQGFFMKNVVVDSRTGETMTGGYEFSLLMLAASLSVALLGPGKLSVDQGRPPRFEIP